MFNLRTIFVGICCIFSLLRGGTVAAQEVLYSPYERFDIRSGDFAVVGKCGGKLYTYRSGSDGFFLDAYDQSMKRLATIVLDFFPSKIYEIKFVAYSDKIVILYQGIRDNRVIQYAASLDVNGRLVKGPIELNAVKFGYFGPNKDYFSSAVSDDKKHIAIYGIEEKGSNIQIQGSLLNDDLETETALTASFHAENTIAHGEGLLTNNGVFYLPVYTPLGSRDYADQLYLLEMPLGGKDFIKHEVPLNSKYAGGTYMKMDNVNDRIYIGGFYSDKKNGNYEGVLYTYYDFPTASFQKHKNIAFDIKLKNGTGQRNAKRALNDFQVKQIIVKNDGGFVMIAENYYQTTRNSYAPGMGYYSYYSSNMASSVREYHYEDILAISYDGEGVSDWHTFIRKNQYSTEDGGMLSSYALLNTGGNIGFLYNDFNPVHSRVQLTSLDADGKIVTNSLATMRADEPDWLPRSGKQVASKEIVVPCLVKKQICFAKIVF
jgi:hypothetical protein